MRVLISATSCKRGGACAILDMVLYYFRNDDVLAATPDIFDTHKKALRRLYWDFLGCALFSLKRGFNPDYIVSLQNTPIFFPAILFRGVRQIIYFHNILILSEKSPHAILCRALIRLTNAKRNIFIAQTHVVKALLVKKLRIPPDKIIVRKPVVIPPRLRPGGCSYADLSGLYSLFFYPAGRFPHKNHELLYKAAAIIARHFPQQSEKIKIILTIPRPKKLRDEVKDMFVFTSELERSSVFELYRVSAALLFPSKAESFGLPLLEAMLAGLPVIALATPTNVEVTRNNPKKLLLEDDPLLWAESIIDFIR